MSDNGVALLEIEDANSTDFEKCLSLVDGALVLAVGFLGKRMDHQLAAMNALCRFAKLPVVVIGGEDIVFRAPPSISLQLDTNERISLFPMSPVVARSTGLHWALDGLDLQPNAQIGCSNMALGGLAELHVDSGDLLVILPRCYLHSAVTALTGG
jgi:thiamine pyrophosphokinase